MTPQTPSAPETGAAAVLEKVDDDEEFSMEAITEMQSKLDEDLAGAEMISLVIQFMLKCKMRRMLSWLGETTHPKRNLCLENSLVLIVYFKIVKSK
jgi:hypothetical protein